jgi:hypothetical protein
MGLRFMRDTVGKACTVALVSRIVCSLLLERE